MSVPVTRILESTFGAPTLAAVNNSDASWIRGETSPLDQKGSTGWLARLYGGVQTGDDWARVNIPVLELFVREFNSAMWSYYMTNAETFGVNIVVWVHDPKDFDKRAEITQQPNIATLEKGSGWNAHELDKTVTQFFFYGENASASDLTAGTKYTWDQFQADALFSTWTIYRITFEYGWEASGTFEAAYLADVKLNGATVYLRPTDGQQSGHEFSEWKPAVVAQSSVLSGEVNLGRAYKDLVVLVPALNSATVSLQIAMTAGGTYYPVQALDADATGHFLHATTAGAAAIAVPFKIGGAQFVKVLCGASQTSAPRTFYVRGVN